MAEIKDILADLNISLYDLKPHFLRKLSLKQKLSASDILIISKLAGSVPYFYQEIKRLNNKRLPE